MKERKISLYHEAKRLEKKQEILERLDNLFPTVNQETGVLTSQVLGKSRKKEITIVRWTLFRILKDSGYSTVNIGFAMNRDHSSVVYGLKKPLILLSLYEKLSIKDAEYVKMKMQNLKIIEEKNRP